MPRPHLVSVIVATYEREAALERVLAGLIDQRYEGFEVIVTDDGSGPATREVVEGAAARAPFPIIHAWGPDRGYRVAESRNRGIAASSGDYLVFLDGDCVPLPRFVADHARLAERGYLVRGKRICIGPELTEEILEAGTDCHRWSFRHWQRERRAGRIDRLFDLVRVPLGAYRKLEHPWKWEDVLSCNMAAWRDDVVAVNGFDELYTGHMREDSDLVLRLFKRGVARKEGRYSAMVMHLWHPVDETSGVNEPLFLERLKDCPDRAVRGLDRHLEEG